MYCYIFFIILHLFITLQRYSKTAITEVNVQIMLLPGFGVAGLIVWD